MSLRIGVDARPLSAPLAGIGRYTHEVLRRLIESEHAFYLYSHAPLQHPIAGRNVHIRTGNVERPSSASAFAQLQFPRWVKRDQLDVFWSPRHHLPLAVRRVPTVVTVHDLVWKTHPETMVSLGALLERLLMPPSVRMARRIIVDSRSTAVDIETHFPACAGKIQVIPLAPFLAPHRLAPTAHRTDSTNPFILFVGTLEPRKNLQNLVEAVARVHEGGVRTHRLVVVGGTGWKFAGFGTKLQEHRNAGYVEFLGRVSDEKLAHLYAACDFLAMPAFAEGFGLPLVEAMVHGKPILTSNCSSMSEVVGDAGILVDPFDVDDIARAITSLVADRPLYRQLSARARRRAKLFSWDTTADETLRVLTHAAACS